MARLVKVLLTLKLRQAGDGVAMAGLAFGEASVPGTIIVVLRDESAFGGFLPVRFRETQPQLQTIGMTATVDGFGLIASKGALRDWP